MKPIDYDFPHIKQAIEEKNYDKALTELDSLMHNYPDFEDNHEVMLAVMKFALENKFVDALTLCHHPLCYRDNYNNAKYVKEHLASFLSQQSHADLIEACVLRGFTSIESISDKMIERSDNNSMFEYVLNHPRLSITYPELKKYYLSLFTKENHIKTFLKVKDKIFHTPELVAQCFDLSIESRNIAYVEYLLTHFPNEMKSILNSMVKALKKGKEDYYSQWYEIKYGNFIKNKDFLSNLYKIVKKESQFEENDLLAFCFVSSYMRYSDNLNYQFEQVYQFLKVAYEDSIIPMSIMDDLKQNPENNFKDFNIYYDVVKLENTNLKASEPKRNIKI